MLFRPLTREQLQEKLRCNLIPGIADFEVIAAEDSVSPSTNAPMIKLLLTLWDIDRNKGNVQAYLGADQEEKLLPFCESIGHEEWYWEGSIAAGRLIRARGQCSFYVKKDKSGKERAYIQDFIAANPVQYDPSDEVGQSLGAMANARVVHAKGMAQEAYGHSKASTQASGGNFPW